MELYGLQEAVNQMITESYPDVTVAPAFEDISDRNDLLIVDEKTLSQVDLIAYRETTDRPVVCLVDEERPHYHSIAAAHRIEFIRRSYLQIFLERKFKDVKTKPILAFWGVMPQVGTTSVAVSVASQLVQQHDLSVGVLGLNLYDPGSWVVTHPSIHLDDLLPFINARNLLPDRLRENTHTLYSGAHYLLGNKNPLLSLKYSTRDIDFLLDLASEMYDILILDLGSYLNTAAALQGLTRATYRYVVAPDLIYAGERFSQSVQTVLRPLGINTEELMLIGNRMNQPRRLTGYAKSMNVTPITGIPEIQTFFTPGSDVIKTFMDQGKWKRAMQVIVSGVVHSREGVGGTK